MTEQERDNLLAKMMTGMERLDSRMFRLDDGQTELRQDVARLTVGQTELRQELKESIDAVDDRLSEVLAELRDKGMLEDRPDDHDAHEATG